MSKRDVLILVAIVGWLVIAAWAFWGACSKGSKAEAGPGQTQFNEEVGKSIIIMARKIAEVTEWRRDKSLCPVCGEPKRSMADRPVKVAVGGVWIDKCPKCGVLYEGREE